MGMYYRLRLFKGGDAPTFRKHVTAAAAQIGAELLWERPGEGKECLELADEGDVHTVSVPHQDNEFPFCRKIGEISGWPWIELRIQDGTLWDYALYHGGELVDTFSVLPQYWDDPENPDPQQLAQWQGKPEVLAALWGIPKERLERYLVNWGYRIDPDDPDVFNFQRTGLAYPTDRFPYGNYEQFFDVLAVLGGIAPKEHHTLRLPAKKP